MTACGAFHADYGFACVLPAEHSTAHFDPAGGYWDERGQVQPSSVTGATRWITRRAAEDQSIG